MKLSPGFDAEEGKMTITVEINLLKDYFSNFRGIILGESGIPKDTEVVSLRPGAAKISFTAAVVKELPEKNATSVGVDVTAMESFDRAIKSFIHSALNKKMKTTEFIPLSGYPVEKLMLEIVEAVRGKRDLCIIKDFGEYQQMDKENVYKYHQKIVKYTDIEYADAVLMIRRGDIDKLREIYTPQLEFVDWC